MTMRIGSTLLGSLMLGLSITGSASAAACQKGTTAWKNPAGGSWQTAANWSNGVPSARCAARITMAGDYQVGMGAPGAARSMTVGASSGSQILVSGAGEALTIRRGVKVGPHGALKVNGGKVSAAGVVRLDGGRLYGNGRVRAGGGVINVGGLLGLVANSVVHITGAYVQDVHATVRVDVPADGSTDRPGKLVVTGPVGLDGTLRANGPAPARQAPTSILEASAGVVNVFARATFDDQPYDPVYSAVNVSVGTPGATPDETPPELSAATAQPKSFKSQSALAFTTSEAGKVDVTIDRVAPAQTVASLVTAVQPGANTFVLNARPYPRGLGLEPGKYRVKLVAFDAAGNASAPVTLAVTVRRAT